MHEDSSPALTVRTRFGGTSRSRARAVEFRSRYTSVPRDCICFVCSKFSLFTVMGRGSLGRDSLSSSVTASLHDAFNVFDADASGTLDATEVAQLLSAFGRCARDAARMIETYDTNGDGVLDYSEFSALLNADIAPAEERDAQASATLLSRRMREANIPAARRIALKQLVQLHWADAKARPSRQSVGGGARGESSTGGGDGGDGGVATLRNQWKAALVKRAVNLLAVSTCQRCAVDEASRSGGTVRALADAPLR